MVDQELLLMSLIPVICFGTFLNILTKVYIHPRESEINAINSETQF